MKQNFKIIYTSDVHGKLSSYNFFHDIEDTYGLSRVSTYLKGLEEPFILLDNGDFLQGNPLLDYTRYHQKENPVSKIFNEMGYHYVTLGNHDFNYGMTYQKSFINQFHGEVLLANMIDKHTGNFFYKPYTIHEICGVRVAIIGLTTAYIPNWEKPSHIKGLAFMDAPKMLKTIIDKNHLREKSDLIVVLYHGGLTKDIITGNDLSKDSIENQAYELFLNQDVDILLTGHQHVSHVYHDKHRVFLQTACQAINFGVVDIEVSDQGVLKINGQLVDSKNYQSDKVLEAFMEKDILETKAYLKSPIGYIQNDCRVETPLSLRIEKHPLAQLINDVQFDITGCDISLNAFPNDIKGFKGAVTLKNLAEILPFENDLLVLEVSGKSLRMALEKTASYFDLKGNEIIESSRFIYPKIERYNYDVYDGIHYVIDVSKPVGSRIIELSFDEKEVKDTDLFKVAMNSYRAAGGGEYEMYKQAKILNTYPISYIQSVADYIKKHPKLNIEVHHNFKVMK